MSKLTSFVKIFPNGHQALAVRAKPLTDPAEVAAALSLPHCSRLLIISGGAGAMASETVARLADLFTMVSQAVAGYGSIVIDGGTRAGVMQLMGEALAQTDQATTHIGVLPALAQAGPNGTTAEDILEPHHSNFVLVESDEWGGEVGIMYKLAAYLSIGRPSAAILVNGGQVSLQEIEENVHQGREVIVVDGSGRLADEVAAAVRHPERRTSNRISAIVRNGRLTLFDLNSPPQELAQILHQRLN
jgi:hypothetical protein